MRKRAMTTEAARAVKKGGHLNEEHYAELIGGHVQRGDKRGKKDVIDDQDNAHSVKAGTWWQVFLYAEDRLQTNTIFQAIGNVAKLMVDCLQSFPADRADYLRDKQKYKDALRPAMRALKAELQQSAILQATLDKGFFDAGAVTYLAIWNGRGDADKERKHYHVFHKDDVTSVLVRCLQVANSKGDYRGQTPEQKVVLFSPLHGKQVGEMEVRHDSGKHYREMKFRLNGPSTLSILRTTLEGHPWGPQVTLHGKAQKTFKRTPPKDSVFRLEEPQ